MPNFIKCWLFFTAIENCLCIHIIQINFTYIFIYFLPHDSNLDILITYVNSEVILKYSVLQLS
jgi:hypothetical protein